MEWCLAFAWTYFSEHFNGLQQDSSISSVLTMEIRQSCTIPCSFILTCNIKTLQWWLAASYSTFITHSLPCRPWFNWQLQIFWHKQGVRPLIFSMLNILNIYIYICNRSYHLLRILDRMPQISLTVSIMVCWWPGDTRHTASTERILT